MSTGDEAMVFTTFTYVMDVVCQRGTKYFGM